MISKTVKYALRTVGLLADHQGEWVQGRAIAAATGIPANYLSKILNRLSKVGLVKSQKGWGGGFVLADHALATPIIEVVEALDGQQRSTACVFELRDCDANNPCPLHAHWSQVQAALDVMMRGVRIGDLRSDGLGGGKSHFFW